MAFGNDPDPPPVHPLPAKPGDGTSIDMNDPKDQAMLRKLIARAPDRFRKLDANLRDKIVTTLETCMDRGINHVADGESEDPLNGERLAISAAKTLSEIAKIQQRDEHHAAEIEAGKHDKQAGPSVIVIMGPNTEAHRIGRRGRPVVAAPKTEPT